jgi:YVTN family beta-propeller protein
MTLKNWSLTIAGTIAFASCTPDEPGSGTGAGYLHGAYVTNEGAFGNSNGSVSYIDIDSSKVTNHLFESVNGRPLGDVVQSMGFGGDKGFIVVNNSQKVEVVDLATFASLGAISGLEYPRHFLAKDDRKGYLTDGNFTGRVYVIDIESHVITDTIPCGSGPEKMIMYGKHLLVANSGGWGNDSTITVIDTGSDRVTNTWTVGNNPADMVLDKSGGLWVLCKGKVVWGADFSIAEETSSTLISVDPGSGEILESLSIGSVGDYYWPQRLALNRDRDRILFLEAEGIWSVSRQAADKKLLVPGYFYGFGVDPGSDVIYGLSALSFTTSGKVLRYQPAGTAIDTLEVGIGPSMVVFN